MGPHRSCRWQRFWAWACELQLALGHLLDEEKQLQKQLDQAVEKAKADGSGAETTPSQEKPARKQKASPSGRRDLLLSGLPQVPLELLDAELEKTARRIGFEQSLHLMYIRGGYSVLVKRTAKYEVPQDANVV